MIGEQNGLDGVSMANNSSLSPPPEWIACIKDFPQQRSGHVIDTVISLINAPIAVFSVFSNILTIFVVWKTKILHTPFYLFLCGLAITDAFTGLVAQPFFIVRHLALKQTLQNCKYLKVEYLLEAVCSGGSNVNIVIISCDRLLASCKPFFYRDKVTMSRTVITLVIIWMLWMATDVFLIFWISPDDLLKLFPALLAFFVGVPLVANIGTALALRRAHAVIHPGGENAEQMMAIYTRERKASITLFLIVGALVITLSPAIVIGVILGTSNEIAYMCAVTITFLSASLNPIIYMWRNKDFRRAVFVIVPFIG